jgi:hypothetical protein
MAPYGDKLYADLPAMILWYDAVKKSGKRW